MKTACRGVWAARFAPVSFVVQFTVRSVWYGSCVIGVVALAAGADSLSGPQGLGGGWDSFSVSLMVALAAALCFGVGLTLWAARNILARLFDLRVWGLARHEKGLSWDYVLRFLVVCGVVAAAYGLDLAGVALPWPARLAGEVTTESLALNAFELMTWVLIGSVFALGATSALWLAATLGHVVVRAGGEIRALPCRRRARAGSDTGRILRGAVWPGLRARRERAEVQ